MPPDLRVQALLWDMLDSARAIREFVRDKSYADFLQNRQLRRGVERELEIIGEAARGIPPAFRAEHPQIPWQPIIAQRHVLAHEYGEIKYDRIWRVATVHLPELIALLEPLVPPAPEE